MTEAGARWFEGMGADAGSPLTVVHYLAALKKTGAAFVPGVMLAWELTVGNSNTRWSSGPPCLAPTPFTKEPPIPWCGLLWPDGTPVSYTEAAAIRRYLSPTGASSFLLFDDFLPLNNPALAGDVVLNLSAGVVGFCKSARHLPLGLISRQFLTGCFWLQTSRSIRLKTAE